MKLNKKKSWFSALSLLLFIGLILTIFIIKGNLNKSKYNVIFIVVDALRADHLSCNGYSPPYNSRISPNIDNLASEGINFENAFCHVSWTLPSHHTMFTSLYPSVHGITQPARLPDEFITQAEIFQRNGYKTGGFVSGGYVNSQFGFDQGFNVYIDKRAEADEIINKALGWLDENKGEKFYMFLHFNEPHVPYDPPEEYKISEEYTWAQKWLGSTQFYDKIGNEQRKKLFSRVGFRKKVIELYDGEINYIDAELGKFFNKLKEANLHENTLIVLTSDHGEQFYEHGGWSHGWLYDESIHVPLIMKLPEKYKRYSGTVISELVGQIDLMPTINNIIKLSFKDYPIQGQSLLQLIKGNKQKGKDIFLEKKGLIGLRTDKYKLIINPGKKKSQELYDLQKDPKEQINLLLDPSDEILRIKKGLEERLQRITKTNQYLALKLKAENLKIYDSEEIKKNKELEEELRSLGYIK